MAVDDGGRFGGVRVEDTADDNTTVAASAAVADNGGRFGGVRVEVEDTPEQLQTEAEPVPFQERSVPERLEGMASIAGNVASGMVVQPVSGLAGLATTAAQGTANLFRDDENYVDPWAKGAEVTEGLQEDFIMDPTEAGSQVISETLAGLKERFTPEEGSIQESALEAAGQLAGKGYEGIKELESEVLNKYGPEAATALKTIPVALLEYVAAKLGLRMGSKIEAPEVSKGTPTLTPEAGRQVIIDAARDNKINKLAVQVDADPKILAAAEELGIDLNPAMYSSNKEFREVMQGLEAKIPDSQLAEKSAAVIEKLNARANEMIAPSSSKSLLDAEVKTNFDDTIKDLGDESEVLYDYVTSRIPRRVRSKATNARKYIDKIVADMGDDVSGLSSVEKDLYNVLKGEKGPTYARLDRLRKDIGQAYQGRGPFADSLPASLNQVYAALRKDQDLIAEHFRVGDRLKAADKLTGKRKEVQDSAVELFGKEMQGSIIPKLTTAGASLTKGDVSKFRNLMEALPASRRKEAAGAILEDLLSTGPKGSQREFGKSFLTAYQSLNRNVAAKKELFKHLPKKSQQRFDAIGKVVASVERAKIKNPARVNNEIEKAFAKGNIIQNVVGWGARLSVVKTLGLMSQGLGAKAQRTMNSLVSRGRYADEMLASDDFSRAVTTALKGDTAAADKILSKSALWKKWASYLPAVQRKRLKRLGAIAWLSREPDEKVTELSDPKSTGIEQLRIQAQ